MTNTPIIGASLRTAGLPEKPQDGVNLAEFARENISRSNAPLSYPSADKADDNDTGSNTVIATNTIDSSVAGLAPKTLPPGVISLAYAQIAEDPTEPGQGPDGDGETISTSDLTTIRGSSVAPNPDALGTLSFVEWQYY